MFGQQKRDRGGRLTSIKSFAKKWVGVGLGGAIIYGVFLIGVQQAEIQYVRGDTVEIVKEVTIQAEPDIFWRLADCESGERMPNGKATTGSRRQFKPNGNIVQGVNTNGTSDIGMFQINLSEDKIREIGKLKLNVFSEEGNIAYAKVLFDRNGTSDWEASKSCWRK